MAMMMRFLCSCLLFTQVCYTQTRPTTDTVRANRLYRIADSLIRLNHLDSSIANFQKAGNIYRQAGMIAKYASCRNKITENLWRKGKYKESEQEANAVLEIVKALGPGNLEEAFAYENIAIIHDDNARFEPAYRYYKKTEAIKLSLFGEFHFELANTYNNLGIFFTNKGDYDSALVYHKKSLAIKRKLYGDNEKSVANSLNNIGIIYLNKSDFKQSLSYYEQGLAIRLKLLGPDHLDVGTSYNNIGLVNSRLGDYKTALENYRKALIIKEKLLGTENQEVGKLYSNTAVLNYHLGDYETAKAWDEKALKSYNKVYGDNNFHSADVFAHIGAMHINEGNYEMGLEYHQNVMNIRKATYGEKHVSVPRAYNNIGVAYLYKKEFEKALDYFTRAMNIQLELFGNKYPELGETYYNIALVYLEKGDTKPALENFNKSLFVKRAAYGEKHPLTASCYKGIGDVYLKQQDYGKAISGYEKALGIYRKVYQKKHPAIADVYNNITRALLEKEDYPGALYAGRQAIAENVESFSLLPATENPPLEGILNKVFLLKSFELKGTICRQLYEKNKQEVYLLQALAALETGVKLADIMRNNQLKNEDKISLAATSSALNKKAVQINIELYGLKKDINYLNAAFYFSEKSKATVLSHALADLSARNIGFIPANLLQLEKELKLYKAYYEEQIIREKTENETPHPEKLSLYETKLFETNRRYDSLVTSFETQFPRYYQLKYRNAVADTRSLQQHLAPGNTAIVEYLLTDEMIYAFVITKNQVRFTQTAIDAPVDSLLLALRSFNNPGLFQQKAEGVFNNFITAATQLYGQLFAPVQTLLGNEINSLVIVPDGILSLIPFEILVSGSPGMQQKNYKELPYLVKKYAISYAYSASFWNTPAVDYSKQQWQHHFAGFAPTYPSGFLAQSRELKSYDRFMKTVSNLAFTNKEVSNAEQYYNGAIFSGAGATETVFKNNAGNSLILHLAMHAIIDEKNPMLSKLIFSGADSLNDGFLNAYELYHLSIPAEMVVISACNTGYGMLATGEGVMSLSRAFSYAGCRSMIMSLWQADDKATAEIMQLFYKHLAAGEHKDRALQLARLEYLEKADPLTSHPYFWGAFIANGDMNPVITSGFFSQYKWPLIIAGILLLITGGYLFMHRNNKTGSK